MRDSAGKCLPIYVLLAVISSAEQRSVTTTARAAIGLLLAVSLVPRVGDPAEIVVLHGNNSLQDAACNPCYDRTTIKGGQIVARRRGQVIFTNGD